MKNEKTLFNIFERLWFFIMKNHMAKMKHHIIELRKNFADTNHHIAEVTRQNTREHYLIASKLNHIEEI
ncbi:hypothetical protein [Aequorivita echinoideorum]|uniref:hypothetical protein n=1 Tax=Aequorivita echinoideorum TaxID=1549647 RepID=UPI001BDAB4D6|nr:hypothetical protein [Aequorivita echinoideorum]